MFDPNEIIFMRRALRLAARGQGWVEPNPMVGCVLVRDGAILGEGWHQRFGGPHAEVEALAAARARGHDPAGCDVYVTLEPCCHFGKTPPCTEALIAAKVRRVVAAMVDPFPKVAGGGLARLAQAGILTETGLGEAEAMELTAPFRKRVATGLPWTIAKWAQTLDGRIATRTGSSKWISSEASRRWVHQLRARLDAIIVGIGTVRADDPELTARGVKLRRPARRVVIDPHLRLPMDCRLLRSCAEVPLTLALSAEELSRQGDKAAALRQRGVELVGLETRAGQTRELALEPLLRHLAQVHQAGNVMIEGGGRTLAAAFAQGVVDQALVFVAPKLLADAQGRAALDGEACPDLTQAHALRLHSVKRFGDDVLLDYRPRK